MHRNAISNALKYGKKDGVVVTELHFDERESEFRMNVINLPGEKHEQLLMMGEKAEVEVFEPGKRLHASENLFESGGSRKHSSGDGAWIIRKCAHTLGGECSIKFQKNKTVFSLRCPARPVSTTESDTSDNSIFFCLPPNTWGIAIDDSKIQRKLLERMFSLLGINKSRVTILGKDADEIMGFDDHVVKSIQNNPSDFFLVIADENLDVVIDKTRNSTISGSRCVQRIRELLERNEECRLLALVRSANDSSDDIAFYNSCAHGFLPKAPLKKDKVLETMAPIWEKRFGSTSISCELVPEQGSEYNAGDLAVSKSDLMQTLEVIDALLIHNDLSHLPTVSTRWPVIWEKIHILKGDLKTLKDSVRVTAVLEAIARMEGTDFPENIAERWEQIRSLVVSII